MTTFYENSRFLRVSLPLLGYFRYPAMNWLYTGVVLFAYLTLLLGELIGFVNRTSVQERVEMLFNAGALIYFVFAYLTIRHQGDELREFLVDVVRPPAAVDGDLQSTAFRLTVRRAKSTIPALLSHFSCGLSVCVFSWCVTPLFIEFDYGNKNFYLGPFLYQCGDAGHNRFPLKALCLNMNTFFEFIAINSLQTIIVGWGCVVYALSFVFFIWVRIFAQANVKTVTERLERLPERVAVRTMDGCRGETMQPLNDDRWMERNVRDDRVLIDEFVKIVQYQQYLHRILNIIIPFMRLNSNLHLVAYCWVVSLSAFLIVNETKSTGYVLFRIKIAGVIANATIAVLVFAYSAEVLSNVHRDIAQAVYCMPWYRHSAKFRRLVVLFQGQLQKSFQVRLLGMHAMNLNLFTRVVRVTYSILNLMLAKFGRVE